MSALWQGGRVQHEVTLLVRAGCHACAVAREDVERICAELGVRWRTSDVDGDPELRAEYGDRVPVILIDGCEHGYWKVEEQRLRAALAR
jgi:glutaredoxin